MMKNRGAVTNKVGLGRFASSKPAWRRAKRFKAEDQQSYFTLLRAPSEPRRRDHPPRAIARPPFRLPCRRRYRPQRSVRRQRPTRSSPPPRRCWSNMSLWSSSIVAPRLFVVPESRPKDGERHFRISQHVNRPGLVGHGIGVVDLARDLDTAVRRKKPLPIRSQDDQYAAVVPLRAPKKVIVVPADGGG